MPNSFSLEDKSRQNKTNLIEQITQYQIENKITLKPFLVFNFPLNKKRQDGLKMLQSEKIEIEKAINLLKGNDFLEKICGAYLLSKINKIPNKYHNEIFYLIQNIDFINDDYFLNHSQKKLAQILSKLINNEDIYLKLINIINNQNEKKFLKEIIILALGYGGEKYFNILKEILNKSSITNDEKLNIIEALSILASHSSLNIKKEIILILDNILSQKNDDKIITEIIKALGNCRKEAELVIKKLIKNNNLNFIQTIEIFISLLKINKDENSIKLIKKYFEDNTEKIIYYLNKKEFQNSFIDLFKKLNQSQNLNIIYFIIESLINYCLKNQKNIPNILINLLPLIDDKNYIIELLNKIETNNNLETKKTVKRVLNLIQNKYDLSLIKSKKAVFGTAEKEQILEKLKKIQIIADKLKLKYPNQFIGIIVFGGISKGYSSEKSDIDCSLIIQDENWNKYKELKNHPINKDLIELFNENNLILDDYTQKIIIYPPLNQLNKNFKFIPNNNVKYGSFQSTLFHGLFFGDKKLLEKIQKIEILNPLKGITEKEQIFWWYDPLRYEIFQEETNLDKLPLIYTLSQDEIEKNKLIIGLLRVPPTYPEIKNYILSKNI